jgi:hypothetical protein
MAISLSQVETEDLCEVCLQDWEVDEHLGVHLPILIHLLNW